MLWLKRGTRKRERRRSERIQPDEVFASYWTGGRPSPQPVRDLSLTGAQIETADHYYPGTLIYLSLDCGGPENSAGAEDSFGIWARAVRQVSDGICVDFVFEDRQELEEFRRFVKRVKGMEAVR
jgi:hypothetical protein